MKREVEDRVESVLNLMKEVVTLSDELIAEIPFMDSSDCAAVRRLSGQLDDIGRLRGSYEHACAGRELSVFSGFLEYFSKSCPEPYSRSIHKSGDLVISYILAPEDDEGEPLFVFGLRVSAYGRQGGSIVVVPYFGSRNVIQTERAARFLREEVMPFMVDVPDLVIKVADYD